MGHDAPPFHRCTPAPPLSEFVDCLWIYEGYLPPHARERLLPTGTMELVFTLDAHGRVASGVAGARSRFMELDTSRPMSLIGVHFRPGGGHPFFGGPSSELHNRSLALDLVWGGQAARVEDQLWTAETPERRFRVLEQTLLGRARGRLHRHPGVRYALDLFDRSHGRLQVGRVAERIGMSPRRLADLFRSEVGLSPKLFCRIRRFDEALRRIEHRDEVDWAEVAHWCGYFDQAHFNHDFRAFSGLSPSSYLRHRHSRTHVAVAD